jgi:hypothetical protein
MKKIILSILLAGLLLTGGFGLLNIVRGQSAEQPGADIVLHSESQGDNLREISAPPGMETPQEENISFIDSPTVTCYQPDPAVDECLINWYYIYVDANPNYMIAMTTTINTIGNVARYHGFFQNSMYVPFNMNGTGFKVACGSLGAGGHPQLGNAYAWTINARDSANLKSANYGTAYCPAYIP